MKNTFCSYEQALALRKIGFNDDCLYCYFPDVNYNIGEKYIIMSTSTYLPNQYKNILTLIREGFFVNTVLAPLKQQVFKWFRDKYGLYHYIEPVLVEKAKSKIKFDFNILELSDDVESYDFLTFHTYEEAESSCIDKLIELVELRNKK